MRQKSPRSNGKENAARRRRKRLPLEPVESNQTSFAPPFLASVRTPALFAAALGAAAVVSAGAAPPLALSIHLSSLRVLAGHRVTLSGELSGAAGTVPVVVYARAGGHQLGRVATVTPDAGGAWSLSLAPSSETSYQARAGAVSTPLITVGVEPLLAVRVGGDGLIEVKLTPAGAGTGRTVALQRQTRGRWRTLALAALGGGAGSFDVPVSSGGAVMRVELAAAKAGPGRVGAVSHPFVVRGSSVSLAASASTVVYGEAVQLSGYVPDRLPGQTVLLLARRFGATAPGTLAAVSSGVGGRWFYDAQPTVETSYRAGWGGLESDAVVVGVRPRLTIRRLGSGRLEAAITPAGACQRCSVTLERTSATGWQSADLLRIAAGGGPLLLPEPVKAGAARVRLSLHVNEALSGYLSTTSQPLVYHAKFASITRLSIPFGGSVLLGGRSVPPLAGQRVTILARTAGSAEATSAATVLTGPAGRWRFRTTPSGSISYVVEEGGGIRRLYGVSVGSQVQVELLGNGALSATLRLAEALSGASVQLERETASGGWVTIMVLPLAQDGRAVFPPLAGRAALTLRVTVVGAPGRGGAPLARSGAFAYQPR